jgi:site-specific DNA-cytosine methylase
VRVLDLCSGLGAASQACVDAGDEVLRVDNSERFVDVPFTQMADVRFFNPPGMFDLGVAGPDCRAFSYARHIWHPYPDPAVVPQAVEIAEACFRILRERCAVWVLENPRGHMRDEFGPPRETIVMCRFGLPYKKPTDLWGNYPGKLGRGKCLHPRHRQRITFRQTPLTPAQKHRVLKSRAGTGATVFKVTTRDPAKRAAWPILLSEDVRKKALRALGDGP